MIDRDRVAALMKTEEARFVETHPRFTDVDGHEYVDFCLGDTGAMTGHALPFVADALTTADVAERLSSDLHSDDSGIGRTLTGSALALAAVRSTLSEAPRDEDFAQAIPLAEAWADGVRDAIAAHGLPWHVQRLGARAEYWFCPPPRDGAVAAAVVDHELDAFMHLWALNRGILLTRFHSMALLSPHHTREDVDHHTSAFAAALAS